MRFDPSIVTVGFCNSKPFLQLFREFDYWSPNRGWPFKPLYGGCLDLARRIGWEHVFDKTFKDEWSERARRLEVLDVSGKIFQVRGLTEWHSWLSVYSLTRPCTLLVLSFAGTSICNFGETVFWRGVIFAI